VSFIKNVIGFVEIVQTILKNKSYDDDSSLIGVNSLWKPNGFSQPILRVKIPIILMFRFYPLYDFCLVFATSEM
jgi:hypothetical protein